MLCLFINIYTQDMNDILYQLPLLALLFVIVGLANNIRIPANTITTAAGRFKETKKSALIEMSLNIIFQILFVQFFGIYGALMGAIVSYVYRTTDFILYANKNILNRSNWYTVKKLLLNLILMLISIFLIMNLLNIQVLTYVDWIKQSILVSFIVIMLFLTINCLFDKSKLIELVRRIKKL